MLDDFSKVSGLRLNDKKTEALWIGSGIENDKILLPGKNLKWPKTKVKTLGLWISTDPDLSTRLNYDEKLEKVKEILNCWKYRRLTLFGKITVRKSLVVSQLVYLFSPLRSNNKILHEINDLFYSFLWNGKSDKTKRKVMINDPRDGGLRMIDLISFNKSLKTTWIKKYLDNDNYGKWKIFLDIVLKKYGCQSFFSYNLNASDISKLIETSDSFFKEVLDIWAELNFESQITSIDNFFEQSLWHNSPIRIAKKPVLFKEWLSKGISKVKHLLKSGTNTFLSLKELSLNYDFVSCPLGYNGVILALKALKAKLIFQDARDGNSVHETLKDKILQASKITTLIYKELISNKYLTPESSQKKWLRDCCFPDNENINWSAAYKLAKKCAGSTKLLLNFNLNSYTDECQLTPSFPGLAYRKMKIALFVTALLKL